MHRLTRLCDCRQRRRAARSAAGTAGTAPVAAKKSATPSSTGRRPRATSLPTSAPVPNGRQRPLSPSPPPSGPATTTARHASTMGTYMAVVRIDIDNGDDDDGSSTGSRLSP
jgi:hypothetical protein